MSRIKRLYEVWFERYATKKERSLPFSEQCHSIQLWLMNEDNWTATKKAFEEYDQFGNPPTGAETHK